jgi:hypothetical protein
VEISGPVEEMGVEGDIIALTRTIPFDSAVSENLPTSFLYLYLARLLEPSWT